MAPTSCSIRVSSNSQTAGQAVRGRRPLCRNPHSGSTSLFFTSHVNAFASQNISTNAGQLYELGFWFKGFAQIDVLLNNVALAPTIINSGFTPSRPSSSWAPAVRPR